MVVTNRHVALLHEASPDELLEMMRVAQRCQRALTDAYHPDGFNLGINQGRCAGAGVADHLHLHILARWAGDSSFMSVVAETRVLPEELSTTYRKLRPFFCDDSPSE
jgi:ATP adenylyltransferase